MEGLSSRGFWDSLESSEERGSRYAKMPGNLFVAQALLLKVESCFDVDGNARSTESDALESGAGDTGFNAFNNFFPFEFGNGAVFSSNIR